LLVNVSKYSNFQTKDFDTPESANFTTLALAVLEPY